MCRCRQADTGGGAAAQESELLRPMVRLAGCVAKNARSDDNQTELLATRPEL